MRKVDYPEIWRLLKTEAISHYNAAPTVNTLLCADKAAEKLSGAYVLSKADYKLIVDRAGPCDCRRESTYSSPLRNHGEAEPSTCARIRSDRDLRTDNERIPLVSLDVFTCAR